MKVTTKSSGLNGARATLDKLSRIPSQIAAPASEAIQQEMDREFDAGADPYGNSWAATQRGNSPVLTDTTFMRSSLEVRPMSGAGISITIGGAAAFHQFGTSKMVARPILPNNGMPALWSEILAAIAEKKFGEAKG